MFRRNPAERDVSERRSTPPGRSQRVNRTVFGLLALALSVAPQGTFADPRPLVIGVCESGVMVAIVTPSDHVVVGGNSTHVRIYRYPQSTPFDGTLLRTTADETSSKSCPRASIQKVLVRPQAATVNSPKIRSDHYPCSVPDNVVMVATAVFEVGPPLVVDIELDASSPPLTIRADTRILFVGSDRDGRTAIDATNDGHADILARGIDGLQIIGSSGPDRITGGAQPALGLGAATIPMTICGAGGRDFLTGGASGDWIQGGFDRDFIYSADGRYDRVQSSDDGDFVFADRIDRIVGASNIKYRGAGSH